MADLSSVVERGLGLSWRIDRDEYGEGAHALAGLALRDNPKRAQLVVSTVLGKHVPVDPVRVRAASQALGRRAAPLVGSTPLVLGFCETATALGLQVAEALAPAEWRYLHSTRRAARHYGAVAVFDEEHSHAVAHALQPADPQWFADPSPLLLVDDELSTGRTALNVIAALHARWPRERYVIASLLDLRPESARAAFDTRAAELGIDVSVVSLLSGELVLPPQPELAERAVALRAELLGAPAGAAPDGRARIRCLDSAPGGVGGRHGSAYSPLVLAQLADLADSFALSGGPALVVGTEELMWAPLVLAEALPGQVAFQSTTRSPVLAADVDGYALRRTLRFPAPDEPGRESLLHNVIAPGQPVEPYADIVVVVDTASASARPLAEALVPWASEQVIVVAV